MIFIHGLGTHVNAYSTILKELASLGYIIFSIDIEEQIRFKVETRETRRKALYARYNKVVQFLDILHSQQNFFKNRLPRNSR